MESTFQSPPELGKLRRQRPSRTLEAEGHWASEGDLLALDRTALALKAAGEQIAAVIACTARPLVAGETWLEFGHARLADYARERLGRSARWVRDMAALGESLEAMPSLRRALTGEDGGEPLGRSAALLVGRIATAESVASWISLARSISVRELKERCRSAREGTAPCDGQFPKTTGDGAGNDPEGDPKLVAFLAPVAVRAAFEEALELFRAVSGREETVASFVEALIAEAYAGPHPPDAVAIPLKSGTSLSIAELRMSRVTDHWRSLPRNGDAEGGLSRIGSTLADIEALSATAGVGDPVDLDAQMRKLLELEDRIERELGRLLAEMSSRGAWARLLFGGAGHYAEERLGLGRTAAESRAQLARDLRKFPRLSRAYDEGSIGMEAALLVLRVLGRAGTDDRIEQAWVSRASEATVRRLRDEARALGFGKVLERYSGEGASRAHELACPLPQGAYRPIQEAASWSHELVCPLPQSDDEWHASLRRAPGDYRKRIALLGHIAAASPAAGDFMRLRLPAETAGTLLSTMEAASGSLADTVGSVPWHQPWPDPEAAGSVIAARTFSIRCRRIPSWVGFLAMLEDFAETWDSPQMRSRRKANAVYIREGWRCAAPGCTSRENLEEHHIVYRSRGGGHEIWNRVCLCRFHHQEGEHRGRASCRGRAPLDLLWVLGAGGVGGRYRNDRRTECLIENYLRVSPDQVLGR